MPHRFLQILLICLFISFNAGLAGACPACWVGYGPGAERFNKALADLRILYETRGKAAIPQIRQALKTSNDPLVQKRAIEYIVSLEDGDAVPLLEDVLYDLVKRVSFSTFGVESMPFQTRLAAAHSLADLGSVNMADKIWSRYDRIDYPRKTEVPYILNALRDPRLSERLAHILNRCEDHQLMVGALDVLAVGGDEKAVPFLREKVEAWRAEPSGSDGSTRPFSPVEYSVWRIKAEQALLKIEARCGK